MKTTTTLIQNSLYLIAILFLVQITNKHYVTGRATKFMSYEHQSMQRLSEILIEKASKLNKLEKLESNSEAEGNETEELEGKSSKSSYKESESNENKEEEQVDNQTTEEDIIKPNPGISTPLKSNLRLNPILPSSHNYKKLTKSQCEEVESVLKTMDSLNNDIKSLNLSFEKHLQLYKDWEIKATNPKRQKDLRKKQFKLVQDYNSNIK